MAICNAAQTNAVGITVAIAHPTNLRECKSSTAARYSQLLRVRITASQLEFIDLIVQYLAENGVMDEARLYESPFTDINSRGPEAIFLPARVADMVCVLELIRERAEA